MPQTNEGILFIVGAFFFLIGILGGGMEISAIKIPPIGKIARILVFGMGAMLMGLALYRFVVPASLSNAAQPPEITPSSLPAPSETPLPPTPTPVPTFTSEPPTPTMEQIVTPTQAVSAASARIEDVTVDYDVTQFNTIGMRIHIKFEVDGLINVPCLAIAYFSYASGEKLMDNNGEFASIDNQVAVYQPFTPVYDSAEFNDFQLFMPYSELDLPNGQYALKFSVTLFDTVSGTTLAASPDVLFDYSQ